MYVRHLQACRKAFPDDPNKCDWYEYGRMVMNRRQPQSMMNLTETGFKKVRAPAHLKELIDDFWNTNSQSEKEQPENWAVGNTYVNSWDAPTTMVSVDDKGLRGSGAKLKEELWAALSAVAEEWTQQELQPCSLYGIRIYHNNSIMLPHVDRLPLVVSAMINVAQDMDEDWPLEVYDHEGYAHNVTLQPGDMLLFESASVIHGHPFPLKGRYYASIFLHFEPTGREYKKVDGHFMLRDSKSHKNQKGFIKDANGRYHQAVKDGLGGQSAALDSSIPPYLKPESPEEEHWRNLHPEGWKPPYNLLPPNAHIMAKSGELDRLERELQEESRVEILTERDDQGWQVLHQGVAGGNEDVVKLLVTHGADINSRTHGGYGETPLRIAERLHGVTSGVYRYLKNMGGLSIGPEL
ncbi:MAG: hypothetical protein SGILL_001868 [Bacillariaceae sp.]